MHRALSGNTRTAMRGLNLYAWLLMGGMSLKATALSISEAKGEFQKILHLSCELGGELHKVLRTGKSHSQSSLGCRQFGGWGAALEEISASPFFLQTWRN